MFVAVPTSVLFTFFPSATFLYFQTFVLSSFLFLLPTLQDFVDFKVEVIVMADTSLLSIFHIFNFVVLVVGMAETEFKLINYLILPFTSFVLRFN